MMGRWDGGEMGRWGDGEMGRWGGGLMGTESANPHPLWPPSCDALQVDLGHREMAQH